MKTDTKKAGGAGEKHTQAEITKILIDRGFPTNATIFCLNKQGKNIWCSDSKGGGVPQWHETVIAETPIEDQPVIVAALSRVLIHGEPSEYVIRGRRADTMPKEDDSLVWWRVKLFPCHLASETVAIGFCSLVPDNYQNFTDEDKKVLRALAEDKTLKEIGEACHRSESAVDSKIKILKEKLGVRNLGGLVGASLVNQII